MISGKYYQAGSARFLPATLIIQSDTYSIQFDNQTTLSGSIDTLSISNRIGQIARKITLQDGSVFESSDNDAIDSALIQTQKSAILISLIHRLERNMLLVIMSIFIVIAVVFSSFKWGLPAASHVIAKALPSSANTVLSSNVLALLDEHMFEPSELPSDKQQFISQHFQSKVVPLYDAAEIPDFKLHFRVWPLNEEDRIPNALALPSGDIIVTDSFIKLCETQDEMDIVLLHEMGHVVERHSLEQVIESSAIVIAVSMAFGDVSWLADMSIGVGSFLISSFYSRGHETEADLFAYEHSLKAGINPASLGHILARMEKSMLRDTQTDDPLSDLDNDNQSTSVTGYFSTHPSSAERTKIGKHYLKCFEQGIINCPKYNF